LTLLDGGRPSSGGDAASILPADAAYSFSLFSGAEVRIADQGDCPRVTVAATVFNAMKGAQNGNFRIARNTSGGKLTVYYQLSGTAKRGEDKDFTTLLPTSAEIPEGAKSVDIPIVPLLDAPNQPTRSVTLNLLPSRAGYALDPSPGKRISDTVMIANARMAPSRQMFWNFGVDAWDPAPTMHNPHLIVSPLTAGVTSIIPLLGEHGFYASLNGWGLHNQCYRFTLTVEDGCILSLTDWSLRWAVQVNPAKLSLSVDGDVVSTASYPTSDRLPADATRYDMKQVVLRPGEHTIKLLCTLGNGPSALLDDLSFSGTMVGDK
jgi:hypothetical protein